VTDMNFTIVPEKPPSIAKEPVDKVLMHPALQTLKDGKQIYLNDPNVMM